MRLSYQPDENALRLTLDQGGESGRRVSLPGYVDMGVGGRIVGIEALPQPGIDLAHALSSWLVDETAKEYVSITGDSAYIELSAPEEADLREQMRSVEARFVAEIDDAGLMLALSIPRHGTGYEISYPSGNQ